MKLQAVLAPGMTLLRLASLAHGTTHQASRHVALAGMTTVLVQASLALAGLALVAVTLAQVGQAVQIARQALARQAGINYVNV